MADLIQRRQKKTAQYFTEDLGNGIALDMILIPGGTFLMGSPDNELERFEREGPQHTVTVPTFFMGRYPIMQEQWRAIALLPQINRELDPDPSHFKGDRHPVEQVSWDDAVEWSDRLCQHTKRKYRLPTEAEWEYGCRAGTTTPFYFGETITTDLANYNGTSEQYGSYGRGPKGEYRQTTTPVDHFGIANAFGLCEMHGNVWEWCLDHWHNNYEGAPTDGSAWTTDGDSDRRVLRGGAWGNHPRYCRSASRSSFDPDYRYNNFGFRVVCEVPRILQ
jgi:formylglycine-generating enzyme required for sulfatase activity